MDYLEWIKKYKVIAIARCAGVDTAKIKGLAAALYAGGIRALELPFDQARPDTWPDTCAAIKALAFEYDGRMLIGAGTVITHDQVMMTFKSGADFAVTPTTQPELIRMCKALTLGVFPGALTPTEILAAYQAGADAVKVFPAGGMGSGYIKAIRAPLDHIPLIAVGGVDAANAREFLDAGCVGLGVGGSLVERSLIEAGDWSELTRRAEALMAAADVA